MTLTFSNEQYRRLVILTMLGEWMVNAIRKDPDPDVEAAAAQLYAFARGTPAENLVAYDDATDTWAPSESSDDEVHRLIDEYDDKTFWEELTARLAERDLIKERGERAVSGMRPQERVRAVQAKAKRYADEFEKVGLDRLRLG